MITNYPHTCGFCGVPYRVHSADEGTQSPDSHYHALVAENARLKALTEWQKIETAPKGDPENIFDKPIIDLFAGSSRYENCFFDRTTGYWTMRVRYMTKSGNRKTVFMKIKKPTHWMPLPESPNRG